jgi:hypothetical protein
VAIDDWRLEIGDCRSKNAAETDTRLGHRVPQRVIRIKEGKNTQKTKDKA